MSVGQPGSREQGNLRKCSQSALESARRNRGALGSAPESALEGGLPVILYIDSNVESTLRNTPESTPISESTLESTLGVLSEISRFSAPWLANRHVRIGTVWGGIARCPVISWKYRCDRYSYSHGNPKYQPFWVSPLFYKAPQENFNLHNVSIGAKSITLHNSIVSN